MQNQTTKQRIKSFFLCCVPTVFYVMLAFSLLALTVWLASELSPEFADLANRHIGAFFRGFQASITNILPFSLAECIIISIPMLAVVLFVTYSRRIKHSTADGIRAIFELLSIILWMGSMFLLTTGVAYNGTSLSHKLALEQKPVSVAELRAAAEYMIDGMNDCIDEIDFNYGKSSVMPYSIGEMNDKLLDAYDRLSEKYPFVPRLYSRVKQVALSEPMTYTHLSGMYTYYTGEANININFPDYTLPYTTAHELAHQRGVLPENEANFVAFLVCLESDDPYIRYSAYANLYEYLSSALYSADYDIFAEVYASLDVRYVCEMRAYNAFFEKYRDNVAADVSSALNDNYLKAQGQTAGEKSYGMVVDLAVAWVKERSTN